MQLIPPPPAKHHWVYDDPSGIAEPAPYARPWRPRRERKPSVHVAPRVSVRMTHREA
jgi:hypothetical protein